MESTTVCCTTCGAQLEIIELKGSFLLGKCHNCDQLSSYIFGRLFDAGTHTTLAEFMKLTPQDVQVDIRSQFAAVDLLCNICGSMDRLEAVFQACPAYRHNVNHHSAMRMFASSLISTSLNYESGFVALQRAVYNVCA